MQTLRFRSRAQTSPMALRITTFPWDFFAVRSPSNQKLVVSAAINQVLQNLLDRLMQQRYPAQRVKRQRHFDGNESKILENLNQVAVDWTEAL
jgi:hypothetical protein